MPGFPDGSNDKESACNKRDLGLIPGLGRSPGKGHGNPLQDSCLGNPMERGAWWVTVHRFAESNTTERLTFSLFSSSRTKISAPIFTTCVSWLLCSPVSSPENKESYFSFLYEGLLGEIQLKKNSKHLTHGRCFINTSLLCITLSSAWI